MNPSASDLLFFEGVQAPFEGWLQVHVSGSHGERFLQSQLTSDVRRLPVGQSQLTALLDRTGRLQAFGFLLKREERIDLLLPEEAAASAVAYLESHVIADDVSFRVAEHADMRLALGAEAVRRCGAVPPEEVFPIEAFASRGFVFWGEDDLGLAALGAADLEALRVLSGLPEWGCEAGPGTPVHATTLIETAVSSDKGCYLGQETVAKVASGRGAARAPVLLEIRGPGFSPGDIVGEVFSAGERDRAGEVLSWARWEGGLYLQAAVVRELRVSGLDFNCRFTNGLEIDARVRRLPFLVTPDADGWAHELTLRAVEKFSSDLEEEAIVLLERAIAVGPEYADAYESLGVILGRSGRYEEAVGLMLRLLEVDPSSVLAHTNLSLYYNQLGRIEDAEREAAEGIRAGMRNKRREKDREDSEKSDEGDAAADRKRRAGMFRQVLELDRMDALGNFGLGELLVEEGRNPEAIRYLERALETDPRYSAALLALGRAHEGHGDLAKAGETYRRGIEVAASRGDLATANKMQERLAVLTTVENDLSARNG